MTTDAKDIVDVFVIGGGINGVGVARDAAGRGFSVCLCEVNDFASGTSSASSKLIHGGLRYLEHYEFGLVRKALQEREVLLKMAPHIVSPMRFVLPHSKALRPWWLLRIGLFLYDHLGSRKTLPGTRSVNFAQDPTGLALKSTFRRGFEYSDCWVDDARLVILNAADAAKRGADMSSRTKVEKAERKDGMWKITVKDTVTGKTREVRAHIIVNAAGPWVDQVLHSTLGLGQTKNVRLVRGSHIVVRKLFDHNKSYIFQNSDGRIIFAIPYEESFTLIGTTDADQGNGLDKVEISQEESEYLCACANEYFEQTLNTDDIVWAFSGVRPLFDDGASQAQEATRDYVVKTDTEDCALLINIFGGKITTYRRLSEEFLEHVERFLGNRGDAWTAQSILPGGDIGSAGRIEFAHQIHSQVSFIDPQIVRRLVRLYGTNVISILNKATSLGDLGQHFGCGLYQAEVEYLVDNEWAHTAEDILYRRTKIGIFMSEAEKGGLETFLKNQTAEEVNNPPAPQSSSSTHSFSQEV